MSAYEGHNVGYRAATKPLDVEAARSLGTFPWQADFEHARQTGYLSITEAEHRYHLIGPEGTGDLVMDLATGRLYFERTDQGACPGCGQPAQEGAPHLEPT